MVGCDPNLYPAVRGVLADETSQRFLHCQKACLIVSSVVSIFVTASFSLRPLVNKEEKTKEKHSMTQVENQYL